MFPELMAMITALTDALDAYAACLPTADTRAVQSLEAVHVAHIRLCALSGTQSAYAQSHYARAQDRDEITRITADADPKIRQ